MSRSILRLCLSICAAFAAAAFATPAAAESDCPLPALAVDAERAARSQLERIETLDDAGPGINAVIAFNPDAVCDAVAAWQARLPLAGRTVLVKDNVEAREWATTAGSLALKDNATGRDAPLIARLRASGGVVLGKTNLSEWANIRSDNSTSGWSAVGGLTKNPHATDRNACGSSSGSAAAVAAGFAWAAIGTETNGSIACPASVNGVVGFKPTVGLVSRTHVIPISSTQDTAGPMATSVADAALLLTWIAGGDPLDPATAEADARKTDFAAGLAEASLEGVRIGVMRKQVGDDPRIAAVFERALADLTAAGAVPVEIEYEFPEAAWDDELTVLLFELREGLNAYLAGSPADIPRSLAELIAFNKDHADEEMRWFGQALFEQAEGTTDRAVYEKALANILSLSREQGIDRLLAEHDVSFLVAPTEGMAWPSDLVLGDHFAGSVGAGYLAAIAGYPHLTVPMGAVEGLPVGLSFIGGKWADHAVLKAGAAYEAKRSAPLAAPSFEPWKPSAE
jgi:amidase